MFANLSTTQFVAFILGICFSGIAVACSFFALRWAKKIKSRILACTLTTIAPFIAISAWFFLIFSFVKGIKEDELLNLFVSMALSLVACFMILVVSSLLFRKNKERLMQLEKEEEAKAKAEREAQLAFAVAKAKAEEEKNDTDIVEVEAEEVVALPEPQETDEENLESEEVEEELNLDETEEEEEVLTEEDLSELTEETDEEKSDVVEEVEETKDVEKPFNPFGDE